MIRRFEAFEPILEAGAWVDETALVVGDVTLGADSSVWPMSVVRGDVNFIRIGACTNIQDGSVLHVTHDNEAAPGGHPLVIGDEVTVGHRVTLHACRIGNRCLIGMGAIVLDGAVVPDETLIGAGSLVPPRRELEGGYLWLGNPVRRVRALTADEKGYLRYSAEHYVRLKNRHAGG